MLTAIPSVPAPSNEPVFPYAKGSDERQRLKRTLGHMASEPIEIPLVIGGQERRPGQIIEVRAPHAHRLVLAKCHQGAAADVDAAISAALAARESWAKMPWQ